MKSRTAVLALVLASALIPLTAPPARASALIPLTAPLARASPHGWRWPLDGHTRILRRFTPPPEPWLAGHRGVDLTAPASAPVLAAGPGTVRFAGPVAGKGVVTIDHEGGLRTTYLPVTATVKRGQPVTPGAELGVLERSGDHCQESCLHWGLIREARYLNPLLLLGHAPIRLFPFWQTTALPAPMALSPPDSHPSAPHSAAHPPRTSASAHKEPRTTPPSPLNGSLASSTTSTPNPAPTIGLASALLGGTIALVTALHRRRRRHHRRDRRAETNEQPRRGQHRKPRHRRHSGKPRNRHSAPPR